MSRQRAKSRSEGARGAKKRVKAECESKERDGSQNEMNWECRACTTGIRLELEFGWKRAGIGRELECSVWVQVWE